MAMSKTIMVIGSLNSDLATMTPRIPSGGETLTASSFTTGPGGKGGNQATACGRLSRLRPGIGRPADLSSDTEVKMLGAVGADEFGPKLISSLISSGVDVSRVKRVEGMNTGVAVILVEEKTGENRILLSPGANHTLMAKDFLSSHSLGHPLPDLIVLQLEIPLPTVLQIMKTAKKGGVPILLNPAPAVPLPDEVYDGLTHLIINESEAALLTGRAMKEVEGLDFDWSVVLKEFISKGVTHVVVTLGAKGAIYSVAETIAVGKASAEKVDSVVDTTAAGDTFVGAYAVEVVRGDKSMEEVIAYACRAASKTVQRKGAQTSIPWEDEV